MTAPASLPVFADLLNAAGRIAAHAHATPVLQSRSLDAMLGVQLRLKAEHLQRIGAFKFRGACNAVWALDAETAARGVVTHSSGNHGAALALAARGRGIPCHVVVPEGAVRAKMAAIEAYGATLHHCAATIAAREALCAQVQADTGASVVHPYTDARVIAGQGTAALELLTAHPDLDALVVPVGGGGLGDLGIRFGYQRFMPEVMVAVVIVLVAIVQSIQVTGDFVARAVNHRIARSRRSR